ncbi:Uncharacterized protein TCM_013059 [Theobroma cacao]|uniref:Uncharacterized protein n=1 Tax=Theobroma cacao TaxID=3641 RepID=A0A061G370_THECC|nr:Uncharacterized protein TCM_013059 [Theobroma cacao]
MPLTNLNACLYTLHEESTTIVELYLVEEEETSEIETEEESCDFKHSDESDDEFVDVDKVEVEVIRDEFVLDIEVILAIKAVLDIGVDVGVIPDVVIDNVRETLNIKVVHDVGVVTDDAKVTPINSCASSSLVPAHKDANSVSGTQMLWDFDDACNIGFKLECLNDCRSRAKAFLNKSSLKKELENIATKTVSLRKHEVELQEQLDIFVNSISSLWNM